MYIDFSAIGSLVICFTILILMIHVGDKKRKHKPNYQHIAQMEKELGIEVPTPPVVKEVAPQNLTEVQRNIAIDLVLEQQKRTAARAKAARPVAKPIGKAFVNGELREFFAYSGSAMTVTAVAHKREIEMEAFYGMKLRKTTKVYAPDGSSLVEWMEPHEA